MEMTYQLLALQLDPNRRDRKEMEDGRGDEGKEGGGEAGRRKGGSAFRTKLKSRDCNSSDLKTILY